MSMEDLDTWSHQTIEDRFASGELRAETLEDPSADAWAELIIAANEHYHDGMQMWTAGDGLGDVEPESLSDALQNVFGGVVDLFDGWFDRD
jgi:hypothetical protein